jgi:hypothetical protein
MPTSPVLPKAYEMDQVLKSRRAQRAVLLPIFKKKIARCPEAEAPGQESRDLSEQKKKDGFEVKRPTRVLPPMHARYRSQSICVVHNPVKIYFHCFITYRLRDLPIYL